MSSKVLRDPEIGLDCTETPFRPPKTLNRDDLAICGSCNLLFSSDVVGPKELVALSTGGLQLNESPLVQIVYNSTTYGLSQSFFWQNGIHRNFKAESNYDMEINLYFRDIYEPNKWLAMAIPITIDNSQGRPYFTELNTGNRNINIENIIERDKPVLVYKGIDLRNRDSAKRQSAPQCMSATASMTWFVLPTTFISSSDANRIRAIPVPPTNTIPAPDHEITLERSRKLCMIIPQISLKRDKERSRREEAESRGGVYLTRALQCQRIDPEKDVRGDAVYLNSSAPNTTLQKELEDTVNLNKPIDEKGKSAIRANDIENILAILVGITVGIVCIAILAYGLYTIVFKSYIQNLDTMDATIIKTPIPCKPPILF